MAVGSKPRGRPRKNKDEAAAPAAKAVKPAEAGHNSGIDDSDKNRALFLHHFAILKRCQEYEAEAKHETKEALKTAEADGIAPSDLRSALKMAKQDQGRALAKMRRDMQMARWLMLPIGSQMDLLDQIDRTPLADRAFEEGKFAGLQAKTCISPYPADQETTKRWIEGWHVGQQVHKDTFLKKNDAPLLRPEDDPVDDPFDATLDPVDGEAEATSDVDL